MGDEKPSMAGLASSFSTEVTLADTVMKPTVAHASWAFLDVIDKTTVLQYSSPLIVLGVAWFIYVFLAGPLYRKIEEFIARRLSDEHTYCVVEMCLFWPFLGLVMMLVMGRFAFTADTRSCFLCAHEAPSVRGFNGFACSFEEDLKEMLEASDNKTTCIAARESLLFPYSFARSYAIPLQSGDQVTVDESTRSWALTGDRITRAIMVTDTEGVKIPLMVTDQPKDEPPSAAHNETLRGLKLFADEDRDAVTVGIHASLGFGKGSVVIRTNAETVQMVVFKQHEQIVAVLIALGGVLLFGTAFVEAVYFDKKHQLVYLSRYYVVVLKSTLMGFNNIKEVFVLNKVLHWTEYMWFRKGTLCIRTVNGFRTPLKQDYYSKALGKQVCGDIMDFLGDSIGRPDPVQEADDDVEEEEDSPQKKQRGRKPSDNKKKNK